MKVEKQIYKTTRELLALEKKERIRLNNTQKRIYNLPLKVIGQETINKYDRLRSKVDDLYSKLENNSTFEVLLPKNDVLDPFFGEDIIVEDSLLDCIAEWHSLFTAFDRRDSLWQLEAKLILLKDALL